MKNKKTSNSYEAAFYMMYGAEVEKISKIQLSINQIQKRGYQKRWIIHLRNIPFWAIMGWNSGITYGNIQTFTKSRLKLKKLMRINLVEK